MSGAILQVTIRGRVQGIGYRAWLEDRAVACELEGWVRNRRDGSVEALFCGPAARGERDGRALPPRSAWRTRRKRHQRDRQ